ncbi:hypothetical protein V6N13_060780 [Hibiscus sabdariffa]|uniref:Uncharacterized protein n=1 Tax=Hibiscus sabdariffa TaxID=183260 RepID=A0ABR2P6P4_9ROSI
MSGFRKHSGPTTAPNSSNPFQFQRPPPPPLPSTTAPIRPSRPIESPPRWDDRNVPLKDYDAQTPLRPTAVASFTTMQNSETTFTAKARFQESKRTKSPPVVTTDDIVPRNSFQTVLQRHVHTSIFQLLS